MRKPLIMMMVKIKNHYSHHKGCQPHHVAPMESGNKNQQFVCFVLLILFSNKYFLTVCSYQHWELQSHTERR